MSEFRLYQLPAEFEAVAALADENGELPEAALERIAALEMALRDKLEGICCMVRSFEASAAAYRNEAERLGRSARAASNNADRLKAYMLRTLEQMGLRQAEAGLFRVRVCQNGGRLPVKIAVPAEQLPEQCRKVVVEADADAVRALLESGVPVPGCGLAPRGEHLRIQ